MKYFVCLIFLVFSFQQLNAQVNWTQVFIDEMTEEEKLDYLFYAQEHLPINWFFFLDKENKVGIHNGKAYFLDKQNLFYDTVSIFNKYSTMSQMRGISNIFYNNKNKIFAYSFDQSAIFNYTNSGFSVDTIYIKGSSRFTDYKDIFGGKSVRVAIYDKYSIGYKRDRIESFVKKPKRPIEFYLATTDDYFIINNDPKLVSKEVFTDQYIGASWFHNYFFIKDDQLFVNADYENRCYIVDVASLKVSFFDFPEPEKNSASRVYYDYQQDQFYLVKRIKKTFFIHQLSSDYKKVSACILETDHLPSAITNGKVYFRIKPKKESLISHYLIPLFPGT